MMMSAIQSTATQGEWPKGESEQMLRELIRYLEPLPLLHRFSDLVKVSVPFDTLEFRHGRTALDCSVPKGSVPSRQGAVSSHRVARGRLCFRRRQTFAADERRRLSQFADLLQLPLRNALRYHRACHLSHCLPQTGCHPRAETHALPLAITTDELLSALENGQLVLYYQPKVAMKSGRPVGLEALLRWHHERHGLISPELFIPHAERSGIIQPISRWVLEQVIRQCARWRDAGLLIPVAVNLSGLDLADKTLPDYVAGLLEQWQIPSPFIELEITETAAISDQEVGRRVLLRLARLGIGVTIDDFGIGYSSLQRLRQLPATTIKIDKSFVIGSDSTERDMLFVDTITRLGHGLGMKVVAEGVECRESWERLAAAGCDMGQGYHFSRPLPVEAMTGWLRRGAHFGFAWIG
jgi:EAL domain-containing protein (putative c-di-GMP-specific phosphodiesterase class I)